MCEGTVRNVPKEKGLYPRPAEPMLPFAEAADEPLPQDNHRAVHNRGHCEAATPSVATVEATHIAYALPFNRVGTALGLIEEAPVEFTPAKNVPVAGVLPGMALLRIKRADGLKAIDPAGFGKVMGLPRTPKP